MAVKTGTKEKKKHAELPLYEGVPSPQNPAAVECEGTVRKIRYTSEDSGWSVIEIAPFAKCQDFVATGVVGSDITAGITVKLEGTWNESEKYGRTFKFVNASYDIMREKSRDVVLAILSSSWVKGVGAAKAELIYDYFGEDTMDIIHYNPERLTEISGIGRKTAIAIADSVMNHEDEITLGKYLKPEVSDTSIQNIIKTYEGADKAIKELKKDPYNLIDKVDGYGFIKADKIALGAFSFATDDPRRVRAATLAALKAATSFGHCYIPMQEVAACTRRYISGRGMVVGFTEKDVTAQFEDLHQKKKIACSKLKDGHRIMYERTIFNHEKEVASMLANLAEKGQSGTDVIYSHDIEKGIEKTERQYFEERGLKFEFAPLQKKAVSESFAGRVVIITGGPGTGKTTCMRAIVNTYLERYAEENLLLCAPTGRAASRMHEITHKPAFTIHSASQDGPRDMVIADEVSMVDIDVMHMLLRLVSERGRLVLIGDPDQLPSVGPGNVLHDLIDSGVIPVVQLQVEYRNGGSIAKNADRVNHGKGVDEFDLDDDFEFVPAYEEDLRTKTLQKYFESLEKYGGVKNTCLIAPIRKQGRGYTSVTDLNLIIRDKLNPKKYTGKKPIKPKSPGGIVFREGDRVMLQKNMKNTPAPRPLVNGDTGTVVEVDDDSVRIEFDDPHIHMEPSTQVDPETGKRTKTFIEHRDIFTVEFDRGTAEGNFLLAYACTVHKCQGMEYSSIIFACGQEHLYMLERNLLYTAITRAKHHCVIVGDASCVKFAAEKVKVSKRNTLLGNRLKALAEASEEEKK